MHDAAHAYVAARAAEHGPFVAVLEIGSRNINGSIRELFTGAVYEGVDIEPGAGVDYVCDATHELPTGPYDCVVSTEVFEHVENWSAIVVNAFGVLMPGGVLIATMAGPGRSPHSALDGGTVRPGEFYGNVEPADLTDALLTAGFTDFDLDVSQPGDLYVCARKAGDGDAR